MCVLSLCTFDDDPLRGEIREVPEITDEIRDLIRDMEECMYENHGVGLAAPQVGIQKQIALMDCSDSRDGSELVCMINPEIKETGGSEKEAEGCLSLPGIWANLERDKFAKVEFLSPDGEVTVLEREGIWARCIQHEVDHLRGKLFIDYLEGERREEMEEQFDVLKRWDDNPEPRYREEGVTWSGYVSGDSRFAQRNREVYEEIVLPENHREFFESLDDSLYFFVLTELHNFESAYVLPVVARAVDQNDALDLRIFEVNENQDLADYYLTYGTGEHPVVVIFNEDFQEVGNWGPRPDRARDILRSTDTEDRREQNRRLASYYEDRGVRDVLEELRSVLV